MKNIKYILEELGKKASELRGGPTIEWRYPEKPPRNPLKEKPGPSWPKFVGGSRGPWKKNGENWFYADVAIPKSWCGVTLDEGDAFLMIRGWMPFTLWVDGEEIYKEEHAWLATGPIAHPLGLSVAPGKRSRLVMCIKPTELPNNSISLQVSLGFRPCVDLAVEVGAACAQLQYAAALAQTSPERGEERLVEKAAGAVDLISLRANRWPRVLTSLAKIEKILLPFSKRAREITVHLIGHSHIDMDWMWTWPDTVNCIRRDFKSVTDMMEDYPELTFTQSQVPTYQVAEKMDPDIFKKIKQYIKEGRWENAAGTWVEGDLNMADGESIARHMLYATDWTKKHLDSQARVLWEPDTFGHPGNMPQLAKLGEFDCYYHMRCNPGREDNWPFRNWEGIDGTAIIAVSSGYGGSLNPEGIISSVLEHRRFGLKTAHHVWGMGDHGGALSRLQLKILESYRDKPVMPRIKFSTMKELFAAIRKEKAKLPGNKGETFHLFEGCFTTHASVKKYNRRCEGVLLTAESLCAIAGLDRTDKLRGAWTDILFNHFHDIFDGAAVHDSYIDAHKRAEKSLTTARRVTKEALKILAAPAPNGKNLALWNPLGFERTEPVRALLPATTKALQDETGRVIPIQKLDREFVFIAEKVPAFSTKSYRILTKLPKNVFFDNVSVTETGTYRNTFKIETRRAIIEINRTSGVIGSYFDKELCRGLGPEEQRHGEPLHDLVGYGVPKHMSYGNAVRGDLGLNNFQIIDEAPCEMSAWLINETLKEENLLRGASVEFLQSGPIFAHLRVTHSFRSSKIVEDILVFNDLSRVNFEARIDWHEVGSPEVGAPQLKVGFAASVRAPRARFEGPFAIQEKPADGMEQPTQKFADITGDNFGFTILNDSKYGCDALGPRLRLTLLRNGYDPDPESDNGLHTVRFAFIPHGPKITNGELVRQGMAYNRPMFAIRTRKATLGAKPGLKIEGSESVVCTALRRAEHSDKMVLRLFETSGRACKVRLKLGKGITSAQEVNFLENPTGGKVVLSDGKVSIALRPFEVKTLLLKCPGLK